VVLVVSRYWMALPFVALNPVCGRFVLPRQQISSANRLRHGCAPEGAADLSYFMP
jgi:hypothetical protein